MKLFFKRKPKTHDDVKRSNRNAKVFTCLVLGAVIISCFNVLSDFPWNGNPVDWLKAKDFYDQGKKLRANYRLADSENKLKTALKHYDKDWRIYHALGQTLIQEGKFQDAANEFQQAAKLQNSAEVQLDLAEALIRQEKFAEAEKAAKQVALLDPAESTAQSMLAYIYQMQGKETDATNAFKLSNNMGKESGRFWYFAALYHSQLNDIARAEIDFKQAAELARTNAEYWEALGAFYFAREQIELAEPLLKRAARINPREPSYWERLCILYLACNDFEQAERCYSKAVDLVPGDLRYNFGLAYSMFMQKKYEQVEKILQKVLKLDKTNKAAWQLHLACLRELGNLDQLQIETARCLQTVESKFPDDWCSLAEICNRNRNYQACDDAIALAYSLSTNPETRTRIEKLKQNLLSARKSKAESASKIDKKPPVPVLKTLEESKK